VGAVVCTAVLLVPAGCSDVVSVNAPPLTGPDARGCRALLHALPDSVADQARRPVADEDGYAAAWGDPPIVLRCGVPKPRGLDKFATCQVVNGVGWFIPEDQSQGDPVDITMTTVGRSQNVQVFLPSKYFPPANAMVDLASAVKRTIREDKPCL
jgi:Protein of unknown function (DUF3515)